MNRKILGAIVLLIIAALGLGYWGTKRSEKQAGSVEDTYCAQVITPARNPQTGEIKEYPTPCDVPAGWEILSTDSSGIPLLVGKNAIYVPDQKPGSSVSIHTFVLETKGFAVIHEDASGKPGPIIGTSNLLKAETGTVVVTLARASRNGEFLYAMLHKDDGDGKYDTAKDLPIMDDAGNPIMMRFKIDINAVPAFESKL